MAKTVLVLLDAFRSDYLTDHGTPFLAACARDGALYRTVTPTMGYCERSAILTGKAPSDTGYLTAIGYNPGLSRYGRVSEWLGRAGRIHVRGVPVLDDVLRKGIDGCARWSGAGMRPYRIPLPLLPFFTLTEDYHEHTHPDAFPVRSLFSELRDMNRSYYVESFTSLRQRGRQSDGTRLGLALAAAKRSHELYLVYVGLPDALGHRYGPESPRLTAGLSRMDRDLSAFVHAFKAVSPTATFVFLGDHGMTEVRTRLDVQGALKRAAARLGVTAPRDYVYFLDSTACRLWFQDGGAARALSDVLESDSEISASGRILGPAEAARWGLPLDRRYGDILWWANPGVLVAPDFFNRRSERVRGMHGYEPGHRDSQGLCIVHGPTVTRLRVENMQLTQVYDILRSRIRA